MEHDQLTDEMAPEVSNIFEYIVWLVWCYLSLTLARLKNPVFALVLSTEDVLQQLFADSLLAFAPVY